MSAKKETVSVSWDMERPLTCGLLDGRNLHPRRRGKNLRRRRIARNRRSSGNGWTGPFRRLSFQSCHCSRLRMRWNLHHSGHILHGRLYSDQMPLKTCPTVESPACPHPDRSIVVHPLPKSHSRGPPVAHSWIGRRTDRSAGPSRYPGRRHLVDGRDRAARRRCRRDTDLRTQCD